MKSAKKKPPGGNLPAIFPNKKKKSSNFFWGVFGWTNFEKELTLKAASETSEISGLLTSSGEVGCSETSAEGQLSAEFQYAVDLQNHGVEAEFGEKYLEGCEAKMVNRKSKNGESKDISKRHNLTARYRKEMEN